MRFSGLKGLIPAWMSICVCNLEEREVARSNKPGSAVLHRPLDYNRKCIGEIEEEREGSQDNKHEINAHAFNYLLS